MEKYMQIRTRQSPLLADGSVGSLLCLLLGCLLLEPLHKCRNLSPNGDCGAALLLGNDLQRRLELLRCYVAFVLRADVGERDVHVMRPQTIIKKPAISAESSELRTLQGPVPADVGLECLFQLIPAHVLCLSFHVPGLSLRTALSALSACGSKLIFLEDKVHELAKLHRAIPVLVDLFEEHLDFTVSDVAASFSEERGHFIKVQGTILVFVELPEPPLDLRDILVVWHPSEARPRA
mmetsp:Transcript_93523/g.291053  ORF Transcript_93523/g.291053 Transcript_93523/m.291053 type:complete len:236 (-) Transcript_93523:63-770(-)